MNERVGDISCSTCQMKKTVWNALWRFSVCFHTTDYDYYFLWPVPCLGITKLQSSKLNPPFAILAAVECRDNKNNNCAVDHKIDGMGFLKLFQFQPFSMRIVNAARNGSNCWKVRYIVLILWHKFDYASVVLRALYAVCCQR